MRILALTKATAFASAQLPHLERNGYLCGSSRPWDAGHLARTRPASGRILELSQMSLPVSLNGTQNTHSFTDIILSLSFSHCNNPLGGGHGALRACLRFGPAISASNTRSSYAASKDRHSTALKGSAFCRIQKIGILPHSNDWHSAALKRLAFCRTQRSAFCRTQNIDILPH